MKIFISCGKSKNKNAKIAKDLYIGELFKKSLIYAKNKVPEKDIYILSAKYGLLSLNDEVNYYEKTLNNATKQERKKWSYNILMQMKERNIDWNEDIIIIAGVKYYEYIIQKMPNAILPFKNLALGYLLKALKESI